MRTLVNFTLMLLLIAGNSAFAAPPGETLDHVRRTGVLLAGVAEDAPPFSFREPRSGELVGYDVDYLQAIASRLGVTVRLRPVRQENRLEELLDGGIDLLAGGLTPSGAREAIISFSDPYLVSGQKIIARKGEVEQLEDLEGKRIGTVVGTYAETCVRDRCTVSRVVPFDSYVEGIRALEEGKIEAFTADETILVDLFEALPRQEFEIPDLLIVRETYHLGMRKADADLRDFVNRTVTAMEQSGEAMRIRLKWFTPQRETAPPAYGSVVRRAATRPRFLGVVLNGVLYPKTTVSIFSIDGERLGSGEITGVFGDEFYVDVDEDIYNLIRPGFLVAMNMNADMAMDVLMRRQDVLVGVRELAQERAEEVQEQIALEAERKEQRAIEMDSYRERLEESAQADRNRYFRFRYRFYRR